MLGKTVQIRLEDVYDGVLDKVEERPPELIALLEEHIDFEKLATLEFRRAFYAVTGRNHKHHLVSILKLLILQKILGIPTDKLMLTILTLSRELREFCGFETVPDASLLSRFRERYLSYLQSVFEMLVDMTEPICREIDARKSSYLIFDTTGIEAPVKENNPKFMNTKLKEAKKFQKDHPDYNPYAGVYKLLPDEASANPEIRQQYINGHYCYALKAGIVTNGLGIVRHISVFDDEFRRKHPETISQKTEDPDKDKEIGDSTALKPVLSEFFAAHLDFYENRCFKTFIGDSSFDSYDNYTMLRDTFRFERVCVPMNPRKSGKSSDTAFAADGTPICPVDQTPFRYAGECGGKQRSRRMKWICHKSIRSGNTRICTCEHPCTDSHYGKCVYTYPDKNFRLYPGIARGTEHWDNLYRHRVQIERTIHIFKDTFALDARRSFSSVVLKADLVMAGISQLVAVLLAKAIASLKLFKSVRKICA